MPEMPDVIGGETITEEWGNDIRDRTVQRYADAATRTSEHGAPAPGDLSYLEDTDSVEVSDGSVWRPMVVPLSIEMDGAIENATDGPSGTFENGATVNFTMPTGWNSYELMAWGSVTFGIQTGQLAQARVIIDGNAGTAWDVALAFDDTTPTYPARHKRTGLTDDAVVAVQYRAETGSPTKIGSMINFVAVRLT